jgi:lipopolysaccharide cholinephosphotransferase
MSKSGTKIESLDEIKKIELDIMISFDRFCKEHGIKYSLAYGTMIGAIRHKGFICQW